MQTSMRLQPRALGAQRGALGRCALRRAAGPVRASAEPSTEPIASSSELSAPRGIAGPIQLGGGATTRRGVLQRAGLFAASLAACPCCTGAGPAAASGGAVFEYGTLSGPLQWGGVCAAGARQSPIDIPLQAVQAQAAIMSSARNAKGPICKPAVMDPRGYRPVKPRILNTGVGTMQANFVKGSEVMMLGGAELELLQFHFHTPSEHAFDGERTAMEVHLVHKHKNTGQLAVIGVLMVTGGQPNIALQTALKHAPPKAREEVESPSMINPKDFLPRTSLQYVRYAGSLTTPGCAEGVDWYVMLDTITISPEQLIQFGNYVSGGRSLGQNSRPVQPLNGRAFDMQYDCNYV